MHKRLYLDYASTTPITKGALRAMTNAQKKIQGNPGGLHQEAQVARNALEEARATIARVCGVKPETCTFVSGGTEANNLALIGTLEALHVKGKRYEDLHVVTSSIEHSSILEPCKHLESKGVKITYISPNEEGIITPEAVAAALTKETVLVSIQYVNSEIGVIQPLRKIARIVHEHGALLHTDAAQAPLYLPVQLETLAVDLLSLDAQKFGGPRGIGALIYTGHLSIDPVLFGGGQERGLRPGTENVPAAVSCAYALEKAQVAYKENAEAVTKVREYGFSILGGDVNGSRTDRIANNINISFPGIDTEYLVVLLDTDGIAVATKSACETDSEEGSYVVYELTKDLPRAESTLRITLGTDTRKKDIDRLQKSLKKHLTFLDENSL